jgi:hypothetical protein
MIDIGPFSQYVSAETGMLPRFSFAVRISAIGAAPELACHPFAWLPE